MANDKQHYLSVFAIGQYNLALWVFAGSIFKSFHAEIDRRCLVILDEDFLEV